MPSKSTNPCRIALDQAVKRKEITSAEADKIANEARNIARNRKRLSGEKLADQIKQIDGELSLYRDLEIAKKRRNMLLSAKALIDMTDMIAKSAMENGITFNKAARYMLLGGEAKAAKGFGGGLFRKIMATESLYKARAVHELRQAGVYEYALRRSDPEDVATELAAMTDETIPRGSTKNENAKKVAEILHRNRTKANAELRLHGGFLDELTGYMSAQTHDQAKYRKLGRRPGVAGYLGKSDYETAFKEYMRAEVNSLWDVDAMMKNSGDESIEFVAREIFDNIWNDRKVSVNDDPLSPARPVHGSLAKKFTKSRVIIYKDPASYVKHEKLLGVHGDNYMDAFMAEMGRKAKAVALMKNVGPSGRSNIAKLREMLEQRVDDTPMDGEKRSQNLAELDPEQWKTVQNMYDSVTGTIDIPASKTIARAAFAAKVWIEAKSAGSFFINSFSDYLVTPTQTIYSGAKSLDAIGKRMKWVFSKTKTGAQYLEALGIASDAFITETTVGMASDVLSSDGMRRLNKAIYSVNLMNWHTTGGRAAVADILSAAYGQSANLSYAKLPEDQLRMLEKYGIDELAWDAIRSVAQTIPEGPMQGRRIISGEPFESIADSALIPIAQSKNIKPTPANLQRLRIEVRDKWSEFIHDRIAAALTETGGFEKWAQSLGGIAKSGTLTGEALRSFMKFKSFPIAIVRRNFGMWENLGLKRGMGFGMATIAGMTIAGYMSMTVRNILAGKERPQLFDDQGEFNHKVLYAAMERGGAFGPYGMILMGEYDSYGNGLLDSMAGPLMGTAIDNISMLKQMMPDDKEEVEGRMKLNIFKNAESMVPFLNLFYIRPAYDHALGWWIKEALQPGYLERIERRAEKKGEEYVVRPTEVVGDTEDLGEMFKGIPDRMSKMTQKIETLPEAIIGKE